MIYISQAKPVNTVSFYTYIVVYNIVLKIDKLGICCVYTFRKGDLIERRLSNPIRIRVEKEIEDQLKIIAGNRGESVSEVCRRLIRKGLAEEVLSTQMGFLQVEIRRALSDVLKPTEDRLAKLNADFGSCCNSHVYEYANHNPCWEGCQKHLFGRKKKGS